MLEKALTQTDAQLVSEAVETSRVEETAGDTPGAANPSSEPGPSSIEIGPGSEYWLP
jgi:hypothetical protein